MARGEARGEARALLTVLAARQLPVDDAAPRYDYQLSRRGHTDRWVRKASTARALAEVFANG